MVTGSSARAGGLEHRQVSAHVSIGYQIAEPVEVRPLDLNRATLARQGLLSRTGATPVFVDIEPDTYNLDIERVAEAIGPK